MNFDDHFVANNFYQSDTLKRQYANECYNAGVKAIEEGNVVLANLHFAYAVAYGCKKAKKRQAQIQDNPQLKNCLSRFNTKQED